MIFAGKNILDPSDKLVKVGVDYLYHSLINPKPAVLSQIRMLSTMRSIDAKRYSIQKKKLPYIVTANFNPPYRKKENFAFIDYFFLDVDETGIGNADLEDVWSRLQDDSRLVMMFHSQSGEGLKLLFRLNERCYDHGLFTVFVKEYARLFFKKYNLRQYVDNTQSDVTYACFISADSETYYNPEAESVSVNDYIDTNNPLGFFDLKREQEEAEKKHQKELKMAEQSDSNVDDSMDDETLEHIKGVLLGKSSRSNMRQMNSRIELQAIMAGLVEFVQTQGIIVYDTVKLREANKLRCKRGGDLAEVNIFYGKSGFNVVQSPRCCTSQELNDTVAEIIKLYFQKFKTTSAK